MIPLFLFLLLQQVPSAAESSPRPDDPRELQAVFETAAGTFVVEFYPDEAPNHVAHFMGLVEEGFYLGTTFHSMVAHGVVQGGDPYTREPERRSEYGTGGFHRELAPETSGLEFASGTVAATLVPGEPASAGSQFFICIGAQPQFAGQFTVFARVVEGLEILDRISTTPTDERQIALERVEITNTFLRPIPPPPVPPFTRETIEELREHRLVMETSAGDIVIEMLPDEAPNHVRHVLRLAALGVYDRTAFHRVAPGFVIQAGDLNTRTEPYPQAAVPFVVPIEAEISDLRHTAGIVSMARGEDLASALTSFFIVLADQPALDNYYTVFGRVVEGMDVVERIAAARTENERPVERVDVYAMRVERRN